VDPPARRLESNLVTLLGDLLDQFPSEVAQLPRIQILEFCGIHHEAAW
jgi:hypothetical protein